MRTGWKLTLSVGSLLALLGCPQPSPFVDAQPIQRLTERVGVTTTLDGRDADPGDGVCEMTVGAGDCSLRAAIDHANTSVAARVEIALPPGTYALSEPGADDTNAGGDLDLSPLLTLRLFSPSPGALIDAAGADGGLDMHSGVIDIERVGVTGAAGAGLRIGSGAVAVAARGSFFANGGPGVAIEVGAIGITSNATVSGNAGGGLQVDGRYEARYVTVSDNFGAGITGTGAALLEKSVVADQALGVDCGASVKVVSRGHNLSSDTSCGLGLPSDLSSTAPWIGDLAGSANPVHPPLAGSPLIDSVPSLAGKCAGGEGASRDQYGTLRPRGAGCDRGALEGPALFVTEPGDGVDGDPGDGLCEVNALAGDCTLRAAIDEATAALRTPIIWLGSDVTLSLAGAEEDANASGDLDITIDLTIQGNGFSVDADRIDRVIQVRAPATLTLESASISGGLAEMGGGIRVDENAAAIITRSTIHDNEANGYIACLGAIWGEWFECSDEDTLVSNLVLGSHQGEGGGGGIWSRGSLSVSGSTISANVTSGRGDCNDFRLGRICRYHVGGGLLSYGEADLQDVTISGNLAIRGRGAGLAEVDPGDLTLTHVTFADNTTAEVGHGFWGNGRTIIGSPTVAGSVLSGPAFVCTSWDEVPAVESAGYNVVSDWSCARSAAEGDVTADPAGLGPLEDNGGPTLTHMPGAGAPPVDRIPIGALGLCDESARTDQRGAARPAGSGCDSGSVER